MQDVEDGAVIERLSEALEGSKFICTYPVVCIELSYSRLPTPTYVLYVPR